MDDDPIESIRALPMGAEIEIHGADGRVWRGTLVPSHGLSGERVVQLKVDSGYNIGVEVGPRDRVVVGALPAAPPSRGNASGTPRRSERAGPPVALLTTGGTIASRVDYRTGGVRPVREESEILEFYPDLDRDGPVRVVGVFDRLSEEIQPDDWVVLARHVVRAFADGATGVVVAHGTDTLAFSAAALSFLLEDLPGPVVLVGAQRSPDRPSSDGFTNLEGAVRLARHPGLGEVVVVMHAGLSDDRLAIHRGTRVRKMHSTRRDAFRTRNARPLGSIGPDSIVLDPSARGRAAGPARLSEGLDPGGALLWMHPGLDPDRARAFVEGLRGVVLAGTGLGHVSSTHLPWIRDAVARGVVVAMVTQTLGGDVDPYVYSTGRELLAAGVLYLNDLLPETAYVKLLWALGQSEEPAEVGRLLLEDRAGEFEPRHGLGAEP
ncbi:MAG TPA: Glu-tRNA(Gln) amidotransferase subunit GatD [Thermoplasmata archaeon]|nr:Glu-tRNA(Gln) amidotransferase subunit GatD [Thermoplasmata archaeon]